MHKEEFLADLQKRLNGLSEKEVQEHLTFYSEMIDDRTEEGLSEEEAVADIGSADRIAAQIIADTPLTKIAKEKIKPAKRLSAWEIVLLVLGSPIWLSLLIAAVAVILSLYAAIWSVIVSLWAVFASLAGSCIGGLAAGCILAGSGNGLSGLALVGAAFVCGGLAILAFFGCKAATKGIFMLSRAVILGIKKCFVGKEKEQ